MRWLLVATKLRPLGEAWRPLLAKAADALASGGLDLSRLWPESAARDSALGRISTFLDLVVTWNARLDLTAAHHAHELVDLYLADALVLAASRPDDPGISIRWVDVGSGGGAPGFVLALLRPELSFTLVEPRQKRVAFLRTGIGSLKLDNVEVIADRSASIAEQSSDVALSRATFSPDEWLREGSRLARHAVWVLLAKANAPVLAGWRVRTRVDYRSPSSGAGRHALEFVPESAREL